MAHMAHSYETYYSSGKIRNNPIFDVIYLDLSGPKSFTRSLPT